jgi:hypothetical protein
MVMQVGATAAPEELTPASLWCGAAGAGGTSKRTGRDCCSSTNAVLSRVPLELALTARLDELRAPSPWVVTSLSQCAGSAGRVLR